MADSACLLTVIPLQIFAVTSSIEMFLMISDRRILIMEIIKAVFCEILTRNFDGCMNQCLVTRKAHKLVSDICQSIYMYDSYCPIAEYSENLD